MRRVSALLCFIGTMGLGTTQGASPAVKFAGEIQKYKEAASSARQALTVLMGQFNEIPAFRKVDGPLITRHLEEVARIWTEAAAALEEGDQGAAIALARRAEELAGRRDCWQERLRWRMLQSQREYLPATAEVFFMLASERNGDLAKEVEAFVEAKKRRSETYGRLAEATTPTADRQTLFQIQDEAFALEVEVGVSEMEYGWAREDWDFRTWVATDPSVASPELRAAQEHLAEWRGQRVQVYRQSRHQQHALERLDRESAGLLAAREKAYRTAKAAGTPSKK